MTLPYFDEFPVFVDILCLVSYKISETLFKLFNEDSLVLDLLHQVSVYFVFSFVKAREFEFRLLVEVIGILSSDPKILRLTRHPDKNGNVQLLFLLAQGDGYDPEPVRRHQSGFQLVFKCEGLVHAHVQEVIPVHLR